MCIYLHSLSALTPFFLVSAVQVMNSSVALFKYFLADSFFNEMTPECYQLAGVSLYSESCRQRCILGKEQAMHDPALPYITQEI